MEETECRRSDRLKTTGVRSKGFPPRQDVQDFVSSNISFQLDPSLKDLILNPKSKKIARPPNAFMIFAREHRKLLASKYPNHTNKHISTMLGECWKNVETSVRNRYFQKAKILEQFHKQQYPGYYYSPIEARLRKLQRKKKVTCKNSANNEVPGTPIPEEESLNFRDESSIDFESDSSNLEYVPNNPDFFPEDSQIPPCSSVREREFMQSPPAQSPRPYTSHPHPRHLHTTPPFNADPYSMQHNHQYGRRLNNQFEFRPRIDLEERFRSPVRDCSKRHCECSSCDQLSSARYSPPRFEYWQNSRIEDGEHTESNTESACLTSPHKPPVFHDMMPPTSYKQCPDNTHFKKAPFAPHYFGPYRGYPKYCDMPPGCRPWKSPHYDEYPHYHHNMYRNYNHDSYLHHSPSTTTLCDLDSFRSRTEKNRELCYCDLCLAEFNSTHLSHSKCTLGNQYSSENFSRNDSPHHGNEKFMSLTSNPRGPIPETTKTKNLLPIEGYESQRGATVNELIGYQIESRNTRNNYNHPNMITNPMKKEVSAERECPLDNFQSDDRIASEIRNANELYFPETRCNVRERSKLEEASSHLSSTTPLSNTFEADSLSMPVLKQEDYQAVQNSNQVAENSRELSSFDCSPRNYPPNDDRSSFMSPPEESIFQEVQSTNVQSTDNFQGGDPTSDLIEVTLQESSAENTSPIDGNTRYILYALDSGEQEINSSNFEFRSGENEVLDVAQVVEV